MRDRRKEGKREKGKEKRGKEKGERRNLLEKLHLVSIVEPMIQNSLLFLQNFQLSEQTPLPHVLGHFLNGKLRWDPNIYKNKERFWQKKMKIIEIRLVEG